MKSKIFLIYLLLIILINDAVGYIVSGKIRTTNDTAVQYAKIRFISQQDTSITFTAITNSTGEYLITITDVSELVTVTQGFQLHQNYPNLFNTLAVVSYQLSIRSFMPLKFYDLIGREIETHVAEEKTAGTDKAKWKAARFARAGSTMQN